MSKKSYKRHQNRLYREIKRRIFAESLWRRPMTVNICERKIETFKIARAIPNDEITDNAEFAEFIKNDMACEIAKRLVTDGYIQFHCRDDISIFPINSVTEIYAQLDVVRPKEVV